MRRGSHCCRGCRRFRRRGWQRDMSLRLSDISGADVLQGDASRQASALSLASAGGNQQRWSPEPKAGWPRVRQTRVQLVEHHANAGQRVELARAPGRSVRKASRHVWVASEGLPVTAATPLPRAALGWRAANPATSAELDHQHSQSGGTGMPGHTTLSPRPPPFASGSRVPARAIRHGLHCLSWSAHAHFPCVSGINSRRGDRNGATGRSK